MATEKEYQALIDALSGECERLHKALNDIRSEIKQLPYQRIFGKVSNYSLLDTVIEIIDKYTK